MNNTITTRGLADESLPYEEDRFVGRTSELDTVKRRIRDARQYRELPYGQVMNFWGVTGIGKTWLLSHLDHLYKRPTELNAPFTLSYSFRKPGSGKLAVFAEVLARSLALRLGAYLSEFENNLLVQTQEEGNIEYLVRALVELSRRYVPLILLDDTEEVEHGAWEEIESRFIEPLVITSRTLIILAGRRYVPRWRKFEVRRRLIDPIKTQIEPFKKVDIQQQIEKLDRGDADIEELFQVSAGNPRIVAAILENKESPLAILQQFAYDLFSRITLDQKEYVLILAPLRYFRFEAVKYMLSKRGEEDKSLGFYDDILRELAQTELVWWHKEHRAYVMDEVARRIINQIQRMQNLEQYRQQHQQAVDMYWEWAGEYPYASEDYILEIWFHLASIYATAMDKHLSPEEQRENERSLWNKLEESVAFIQENLSYGRLRILENQLFKPADIITDDEGAGVGEHVDGDTELRDMLPPSISEKLARELSMVIKEKEHA